MANPGFPDDALVQILVRLPLKSLLRFRCVSKPWNVLISSKHFAKMLLKRSLIHLKPLRLMWKEDTNMEGGRCIRKMRIFTADCSNLENSTRPIQPLHHPLEVPSLIESTLIGSCNGLLCLLSPRCKDSSNGARYDECFFMVNPLTRRCSFSFGAPFDYGFSSIARSTFYGFGYDDVHDDYKVVTWGVRPKRWGAKSDCSKIEVYSTTNASWKTIISGLTDWYVDGISCGVLVNCTLHWISINNEGRCCIVAFDLRTDEHRLMEIPENDLAIPQPDDMNYLLYRCRMELGVMNDSLCGVVYDNEVSDRLDLWVMKEYDIHGSWTKMTIETLDIASYDLPGWRCTGGVVSNNKGRMTQVVAIVYMENKKQLILYSYNKGFLLCDMISKELSKIIKLRESNPEARKDYPYVAKEFCFQGSLVELPGFDSFDALSDELVAEHKTREEECKRTSVEKGGCGISD